MAHGANFRCRLRCRLTLASAHVPPVSLPAQGVPARAEKNSAVIQRKSTSSKIIRLAGSFSLDGFSAVPSRTSERLSRPVGEAHQRRPGGDSRSFIGNVFPPPIAPIFQPLERL